MAPILKYCEHCNKPFATISGFITQSFCSDNCNFLHYFTPIDPDKCWEWKGRKDEKGYGGFGKNQKAYRYSFRFYKGKLVTNQVIRHLCNNPGCVNPHHLEQGTYKENSQDMLKAKRHKPMKGELNGGVKLTEKDVLNIFESKEDYKVLAQRFNISKARVRDILSGRGWNHITGLPKFTPKRTYKKRQKKET